MKQINQYISKAEKQVSLDTYITEKFKINKNTKIQKRDLSHVKDKDITSISIMKAEGSYKPPISTFEAHTKGIKPEKHVNHIKDLSSLIYRWYICIVEGWEDYYVVFKNTIIKKSNFTEDELDAYILDLYNRERVHKSFYQRFEDYLDFYNIEYEKKNN